jgi:acyl transferase domain-containing protein/acyl carrier protein
MLYPGEERANAATQELNQTFLTQPALFVIEYALAQLLMEWGIRPEAMIGYSIGEYVAACLAGVFSLQDALFLVAKRAQMIQELPDGSMLAVPLTEKDSYGLLGQTLSLAAVNGPNLGVVSGPEGTIAALEQQLVERGLACRRLQTSHAFHSKMMDPIAKPFTEVVESVTLNSPQIPLVSNLTGTWMTPAQATDPSYWSRHMCETVRFGDGIEQLWAEPSRVLLEVGPGQTLCTLVMQHPKTPRTSDCTVLSSLRHSYNSQPDGAFLLNALGELWLAGIPVNWSEFHSKEGRDLIPAQPDTYARDSNQEGMSPLSPRSNLRNPYVAPGTEMEHKIAKIWQELLGIEQVGIHDNFFKVGGQSLQGIQLISRLRAAFKVDLPLQALFETPTVTGLALTIEEMLIAEIEQLSEDEAVRSA